MSESVVAELMEAPPRVGAGTMGSATLCVLLINTMNGPGLVTLPRAGRDAGIVPFVVLVCGMAWAAAFASRRVCAVVDFQQKAARREERGEQEYVDLALMCRRTWGDCRRTAGGALGLCLLCLALAQMVLCCQVAEKLAERLAGASCRASVDLSTFPLVHVACLARGEHSSGPSVGVGAFVTALLCVCASRLEFMSHSAPQFAGAALLVAATARTVWRCASGESVSQPVVYFGHSSAAFAPVVFNFSYVVAVPSLCLDSREGTAGVRLASDCACFAMALAYLALGLCGAVYGETIARDAQRWRGSPPALEHVAQQLLSGDARDVAALTALWLAQLAAIPTYCELAARSCRAAVPSTSPAVARALGTLVPWAIAASCVNSEAFAAIVDWSSLLVVGFVNFSLPLALDYANTHPPLGAFATTRWTRRCSRALLIALTAALLALIHAKLDILSAPAALATLVAAIVAIALARRLQNNAHAPRADDHPDESSL